MNTQSVAFSYRHLARYLSVAALAFFSSLGLAQGGYTDLAKAPAGVYSLEKTHAYIALSYLHQGASRPVLLFRAFDASIDLDPADLAGSSIKVAIDPGSIDSGVDEFDEHLVGEDMFHTEKYPDASYVSTAIKALDNGQYLVEGELTLKGVTKPLNLTASFNRGGIHMQAKVPHLGFSATGTLKRSEWNLGYAVPFVGDQVDLTIETEFLLLPAAGAAAQ